MRVGIFTSLSSPAEFLLRGREGFWEVFSTEGWRPEHLFDSPDFYSALCAAELWAETLDVDEDTPGHFRITWAEEEAERKGWVQ